MDPEVQGCGDDMEEEAGAEDLGLEAGVKNLGESGQLPLIRDKEAWMDVDLDPLPLRRPSLLSHLSIASTETIEGNSSEGNTFSVNSQESGLIPQSSATPSSAPGDNNQVSRSEWKHGKSFSNDSRPATRGLLTLPCPPTASSQLVERVVPPLLALSVNNFSPENVSISYMSLDGEDAAPSPPEVELAQMESKGSSPVSDGALAVAGTMFESVETEPEKRMTESNKVQSVAPKTSSLPLSPLTGNSKDRRPSDIRELRPEDAIHDWHNDEETEGYRQVYEHRKEIREQSRFRSPAVTPREAPDQPSFSSYFGSSYSPSAKGKERDRLPADDFDLLQEDFTPSEGRPRKVRQNEQNRQASPQSHYSNASSEHDRAKFDSAIRALQKGVHFQPRIIPPRDSVKARESSSCATLRDRGQPCETAPAQFQRSSTSLHSPRLGSHERMQGLSRRPSTKRAHSHMMSWDTALLSPAPRDDLVEENEPDRKNKAMGLAMSPGSATLDVNIIEQAFTAGIVSTDSGRKVVAEGGITSNILNNIVGYPRPASPSAATVSSVSTAGSRRQFSSYKGSSLPEIQATTTHTELFYLAFGNGGSSSRQSLTGRTVQKKRERAENDKAHRDLRAADKLEKEERRKQPYNDKFERPANDDTTTESQSESVSEGYGSSVEDSGTLNRVKTMSNDNGGTEDDEERRRIRQEACAKRRARQPRSPEQIVSAAVIMPVTGMIVLKDGGAISNEAESRTATAQKSGTAPPVSEKSSGSSVRHGPKVQNSGQTLHPHGTFTTARHPSMTVHADAIRARALVTDERFDTINTDQLQAAADAGDQIAEAHLHQRQRRSRMVTSQEKLPADAMPAERPLRNRPPAIEGVSRRKSSVASPTSLIPRKPTPVLQTIQEGGAVNLASTQAERKTSRDISSQVEQLESRRSSGSTISSGRLSNVSIGSAVEALFEAIGNKNVPVNLPIKLLPLAARSRSMDQTAPDAANFQTTRSGSVPTTPLEFAASKRSPFVSNPALPSGQELYRAHAFPPVTSPHTSTSYAETTPIRRDLNLFVAQPRSDPFSPTSESELFLEVGRLTSRQVEKDRALDRAQDARNKGLATESLGNQRARAEATQRSRVRQSLRNANVTADTDAPQEESDIVSAMASFGISYETRRRPSVDNSLDPLAQEETKEQRLAAHQQRKRMRRKLEHERVIRETPMGEYSNPFDTHLGGLSREKKVDVVQTSQVAESICEEDEGVNARSTSVFASTAADMARGEG
ncbi:hypothetical protein QFC21_001650 [Naganishia friedmannii]|uniref:Uncharacterized protein n=1 Tax=Naganishia friedmannii TaxID=89922 RepID=A0ACC2W2G3_9TREE|nr:hypothetical protein QFC21_001650 [Naganishia friedmannii]